MNASYVGHVYDPRQWWSATDPDATVWSSGAGLSMPAANATLLTPFDTPGSPVCGTGTVYTVANPTYGVPQVALFGAPGCSTSQFNVPSSSGGLVGWHPGPNGMHPQLLLTLPSSGTVRIVASAFAMDVAGCGGVGATTDVHAFVDGTQVWSGNVAVGSSPSVAVTAAVSAGSIVSFGLGDGGNGYYCDLTLLVATVTYTSSSEVCVPSSPLPSLSLSPSPSASASGSSSSSATHARQGLRGLLRRYA